MSLAVLILHCVAFVFQQRQLPPGGGNDDFGVAVAFALLVALAFVFASGLLALPVVGIIVAVQKITGDDEIGGILAVISGIVFLAAPCIVGYSMWYYWPSLSPGFVSAAEYAWLAVLLIVGVGIIILILAAIFSGIRSAFSRENVGGTLGLIAVAAATFYLYNFAGWGFWSALGVSFGGILAVSIVVALLWDLASRILNRSNRTE